MKPTKCKRHGCYTDACCVDGCCALHTSKISQLRPYATRIEPKSDEPHLGVEIECFADSESVFNALRAQRRVPCSDGSLPTMGCEFKVCLPVQAAISKVPQFVRHLASIGAKVNTRCGLHVHMDMRGISTHRQIGALVWAEFWQDWMFGLMPPSRRVSTYCTRLPFVDRYNWLTRTYHKTMEVRIHGGTLNPHKVAGWLSVCADLMAFIRDESKDFPVIGTPVTAWTMRDIFPTPIAYEYLRTREAHSGVLRDLSDQNNTEEQ